MNRKFNLAIKLAMSLLLSTQAIVVSAQESSQNTQYLIGSGVPGSVPYNIGVGLSSLAQLVLLPDECLNLSPATADSYHQSLQQLNDGTTQFAIVDSVSVHQALAGHGDPNGIGTSNELMAVATLWHEVDHFIIANGYVQSGTISDLAILRSENLATNLGNFEATRNLLARFGVRLDGEPKPVSSKWEALRDDVSQGAIAGLAITGSAPSRQVQDMLSELDGQAQLLEFSNWQAAQIDNGWHVHSLTTDDYPGLNTQVDTLAP